jgi:hypothetical protein
MIMELVAIKYKSADFVRITSQGEVVAAIGSLSDWVCPPRSAKRKRGPARAGNRTQ